MDPRARPGGRANPGDGRRGVPCGRERPGSPPGSLRPDVSGSGPYLSIILSDLMRHNPAPRRQLCSPPSARTPTFLRRIVRRPVESGIEKRGSRVISRKVCPWNSFATPSSEEAFLGARGAGRALAHRVDDDDAGGVQRALQGQPHQARQTPRPAAQRRRRAGQPELARGRPRARRRTERRGAARPRARGVGAGAQRHGGGAAGAAGKGRWGRRTRGCGRGIGAALEELAEPDLGDGPGSRS